MKLEESDIKEFQRLYEEAFGEQLTDAQAEVMAGTLFRLYQRLSKPPPEPTEGATPPTVDASPGTSLFHNLSDAADGDFTFRREQKGSNIVEITPQSHQSPASFDDDEFT